MYLLFPRKPVAPVTRMLLPLKYPAIFWASKLPSIITMIKEFSSLLLLSFPLLLRENGRERDEQSESERLLAAAG